MTTADITDGTEDGRLRINLTRGGNVLEDSYQLLSNRLFLEHDNHSITWNNTRGTSFDVDLITATPTAARIITLPDATGTVLLDTGNQTLTGNLTLIGELVADGISLGNNDVLKIGNSDEFRILHNGSQTALNNLVGNVIFRNYADDADIDIMSDDGSGSTTTYFKADGSEGSVRLYHYGAEKFQTTSDGVNIFGDARIRATSGDANQNPSLILDRQSSSPADDDNIGDILFRGKNDANEDVEYAHIAGEIADVTDGTEDGRIAIEVMRGGTLTRMLAFNGAAGQMYASFALNMQQNNINRINQLSFEGSTNDTNDTILKVADPTATRTITLPDATGTVLVDDGSGNVAISGNLTVSGTTTTVNSSTLSVQDPLIILANNNNSSDVVDIGFYGLYDTSGSQDLYAGLFRDASDSGKFKLFKDLQVEPTTTVNTGGTGYAVGTLVANLEGNALTIDGDATFNGASGNLVFDKSADILKFGDDLNLIFGDDNDLRIFHSAGSGVIRNQTSGRIYLQSDNTTDGVIITKGLASETMAKFRADGPVELYYDNAKKFETETNGVIVTGRLTTTSHIDVNNGNGFGRIELGGSSGGFIDLKSPFTDDFDSRIITTGTNLRTLQIQSDDLHLMSRLGNAYYLDATVNGAVNLYYNNSKVFETASTGVTIEDPSDSSASKSLRIIGKRSDANDSYAFSGKLMLATNRTDQLLDTGKTIGIIGFGGNHTDGTVGNILYSSAITGVSEGDFNSATDMPTGLAFFTGSTGRDPDTPNVTINTERMRIDKDGNVGIGTSSPAVPLDVAGQIRTTNGSVDLRMLPIDASNAGIVGTYSNDDLVFNANSSEVMRVRTNSKVGIGTVSPSGKLSVAVSGSDANSSDNLSADFDTWIRIGDGLGAKTFSNGSGIKFHDSGLIHWSAGILSDGHFAISKTSSDGSALFPSGKQDALTIDSSLNIDMFGTLSIISTDAGAGSAPLLELYRHSASPAASDFLGRIDFYGEDDNDDKVRYASITSSIMQPTNGNERGRLELDIMQNGSMVTFVEMAANTISLNKPTNISNTLGIISTVDGGPILTLRSNDPGDVADFNTEGIINYTAENSANEETTFAQVKMLTDDVTDGTEDGRLVYSTMKNGTLTELLHMTSTNILLFNTTPLSWYQPNGTNFVVQINPPTPTASRNINLPDASGTVLLNAGNQTLTGDLTFPDNEEIKIGTDGDLRIYHNGNNSYIDEGSGTGALIFKSNFYSFRNAADSAQMAIFDQGGMVRLFHNGAEKIRTLSDGGQVFGDLTLLNSDDDASQNPTLILKRDSASPANSDLLGDILFQGNNDNSEAINYAQIHGKITNASDSSEGGYLEFKVMQGGSLDIYAQMAFNNLYVFKQLTMFNTLYMHNSQVIKFEGATGDAHETTLTVTDPTADRTITLPDATGTVLVNESGTVNIESTDAGASDGPILNLFRNSASPAANDQIGEVRFLGKNDAGQDVEYGSISSSLIDATDGSEDARTEIRAMLNGVNKTYYQAKFGLNEFQANIKMAQTFNIAFEGATNNDFETTLTVVDPTADRTISLPDATGTVVVQDSNGDATIGGGLTVTGGNSGDVLLTFATDRSWQFQQSGDNAATRLQLKSNVDSKLFDIVNSGGNITHTFFTSTVDPSMTLTAYDADATEGPKINLTRNSASPAVNDLLGAISFKGEDSASNEIEYARITGIITDPTDGSEGGLIRFEGVEAGNRFTAYQIGYSANFFYRDLHLMQNTDIRFEGSTDDNFETLFTVTDPTADRTITLPDATGDVVLNESGNVYISSTADLGPVLHLISNDHSDAADFHNESRISFKADNDANQQTEFTKITLMTDDVSDGSEDGRIRLQAMANGTMLDALDITGHSIQIRRSLPLRWEAAGGSGVHAQLQVASITAGRTYTLPDATGTILTTGNSDTPTTTTSSSDADFVLIDDGGTMKKITPSNLGIGSGGGGGSFNGTLTSTDAGSTAAPILTLDRNSASPADGDFLGDVQFKGRNDAGETITYGSMGVKIEDMTDGTEDSRLIYKVQRAGELKTVLDIKADQFKVNNVSEVLFGDPVSSLKFEGATGDDFELTLAITDPTADRTVTVPDASGTIALKSEYFQAFRSSNSANLTSSFAKIDFDTVTLNSNNSVFVESAGEVTINKTGIFRFSADVTTKITSGGSRSDCEIELQKKPSGGSFSSVTGTTAITYNRTSGRGDQTASINFMISVTSGDTYQVVVKRQGGSDTIVVQGNAARFNIQEVN